MKIDINNWKNKLNKPAGLQAQLLMAPQLRKEELDKYHNSKALKKSAVLILIYIDKDDDKPYIILTLRSSKLKNHSGQISFPGGKMDAKDENIKETALREAEEEIGLNRKTISIIGQLSSLLIPVSKYKVYPIVAFANSKPQFKINTDEVEKLLLIPLEKLLKKENIKQQLFYKTTTNKGNLAPYFDIDDNKIWGATAMMISELIVTLFSDKHPSN